MLENSHETLQNARKQSKMLKKKQSQNNYKTVTKYLETLGGY